ncbi:2-hydroxychromene-2-carboxylate isomerase [Nitrogeniibacter mangrovi]|uniref:2-hydroxychromene-2-carboxylate isomerase n=1 Tax=Nitrogeniibacter mangrovi TaxID=2016596 RepID=A0A6C1B806_9RHOO|nr:2-hydroxychromene-2-carboxylate isomerase [Nitrogeniibacter mangrovi]QID19503.1 2-hydroxychromene-2-carboxylate isomerase [Nitrogeniibacter mangrovi]
MPDPVEVKLFFNFRSPYCYLASKKLWPIVDDYDVRLLWRPVGGWHLRSSPDRAKSKMPLARQDVARFARRMGIPVNPPPVTTDPTRAGAGSLLAEREGLLRPYIVEVMRAEWAHGRDIGDTEVLLEVGERIGLAREALAAAIRDDALLAQLERNAAEAAELSVIGVPTFVIDEEIFWGQDRIDFVLDALRERRAARL